MLGTEHAQSYCGSSWNRVPREWYFDVPIEGKQILVVLKYSLWFGQVIEVNQWAAVNRIGVDGTILAHGDYRADRVMEVEDRNMHINRFQFVQEREGLEAVLAKVQRILCTLDFDVCVRVENQRTERAGRAGGEYELSPLRTWSYRTNRFFERFVTIDLGKK